MQIKKASEWLTKQRLFQHLSPWTELDQAIKQISLIKDLLKARHCFKEEIIGRTSQPSKARIIRLLNYIYTSVS